VKTKYIKRLVLLANYLKANSADTITSSPQKIFFYDSESKLEYECEYHHWIFQRLPWVNEDWLIATETQIVPTNHTGDSPEWTVRNLNPLYRPINSSLHHDPFRASVITSVLRYYGLQVEMFLHLFGAHSSMQRPEQYGGRKYPKQLTAGLIAENINHLINTIMKQRTEEKYNRLLKLADFIASQREPIRKDTASFEMLDRFQGNGRRVTLTCLDWIFSFFPDVFTEDPDDWYIESFTGEIIYGQAEDPHGGNTISCVFTFFNLSSVSEFKELFCVNDFLTVNSGPKEVAENIVHWVKRHRHGDEQIG
jgi:hypothetical protein